MTEEPIKVNIFGLGIIFEIYADGKLNYNITYINDNVPEEIIIIKLEKLLNELKREYFSKEGNE